MSDYLIAFETSLLIANRFWNEYKIFTREREGMLFWGSSKSPCIQRWRQAFCNIYVRLYIQMESITKSRKALYSLCFELGSDRTQFPIPSSDRQSLTPHPPSYSPQDSRPHRTLKTPLCGLHKGYDVDLNRSSRKFWWEKSSCEKSVWCDIGRRHTN